MNTTRSGTAKLKSLRNKRLRLQQRIAGLDDEIRKVLGRKPKRQDLSRPVTSR